ncbi:MAG: hypothetical protein OEZ39_01640 [Gammaproteobacteria bacterium]|nr:hypothetical protein [Gammaproteobacteria bacterium]MDH5650555.1 hypothetical protein [Gammaproteobacteria bacterium]
MNPYHVKGNSKRWLRELSKPPNLHTSQTVPTSADLSKTETEHDCFAIQADRCSEKKFSFQISNRSKRKFCANPPASSLFDAVVSKPATDNCCIKIITSSPDTITPVVTPKWYFPISFKQHIQHGQVKILTLADFENNQYKDVAT